MYHKFTMSKELASVVIERVHEENLPISIYKGKEAVDENGDRQVDVLLECEDMELVNQILSEELNKMII